MITERYPLATIILLSIVANLFLLFNNGWYWDDWCLSSYEGIVSINKGVGQTYMIPITSWLMNLTSYPALFFHVFSVILEILCICLFYISLKSLKFDPSSLFVLTLFFALLPYNQARITIACFLYSVGLFFFLSALFLFIKISQKNNLILRILSLICFFLSYLTLPSTLVMALAVILLLTILYIGERIQLTISYAKKIFRHLSRYTDFILLPFSFWFFRSIFLKPTGVYAADNYREFSFNTVLLTPVNLVITFIQNFVGLGTSSTTLLNSSLYAIFFLILILLLIFLFRKISLPYRTENQSVLFAGLYLFFAGSFAYVMVGLLPLFDGYESRHQILLRFGSSFVLLYIINLIESQIARKYILIIIVSSFMLGTLARQLQFQKSWFKQEALELEFKNEILLTEGTNFVIVDNTKSYNEYNLNYAFYCYTGILRKSFKTQTRFAIDSKALIDMKNVNPDDLVKNAFYHIKESRDIFNFRYTAFINPGETLLSNAFSIKLLYLYYFDNKAFDERIGGILSINFEDYKPWHL